MKLLVLGGGAQGSAAAYDLLRMDDVEVVVMADLQTEGVAPFLRPQLGGRLRMVRVDARDEPSVRAAMVGVDAVVCALPYYFNHAMSRFAIEAGAHFADLGGNTEIVERQRGLDEAAQARRVSVIPDCGLAPGMVNILAQAGIDELDETMSVRMWVGGLPRYPEPPLNYQIAYSLEGVLDYYTTPGLVLRNWEPAEVEPLTGREEVSFPEPLGVLEAFYTAGGVSTLPHRYRGRIQTMEYKSLRYPGHVAIMRGIRDLGLLDTTPVKVDGAEITPRQFFIDRVTPRLKRPGSPDLAVLRVDVRGRRNGTPAGTRFEMMDQFDPGTGISAMMRVTGFSLSLTALMQCRGQVRERGVRTPDETVEPSVYLEGMEARGIRVRRTPLPD